MLAKARASPSELDQVSTGLCCTAGAPLPVGGGGVSACLEATPHPPLPLCLEHGAPVCDSQLICQCPSSFTWAGLFAGLLLNSFGLQFVLENGDAISHCDVVLVEFFFPFIVMSCADW